MINYFWEKLIIVIFSILDDDECIKWWRYGMNKFLKWFLVGLLIVSVLNFSNVMVHANNPITIYVNGVKQSYGDKAKIENGSTLVPLRGIFETLGATVTWNGSSRTIDIMSADKHIWLQVNSKTAKVNNQTYTLPIAPKIVNGSTLVPLRFISEMLGAEVGWDGKTRSITIDQQLGTAKVHFIDVGQGDATFIQFTNGTTVLIDAGTADASKQLVDYLQTLQVKTIDYAIATHPDADHIGGFERILQVFEVRNFVDSGRVHTTKTYENLLQAIDQADITFIVPEKGHQIYTNADTKEYLTVLYADSEATETNDASIVLKGGYCENDFLLMGDATNTVEKLLMASGQSLSAEIYKAGHHGSSTSNYLDFMRIVNPKDVILSYGQGNAYGHPHSVVIRNINLVGATSYATAEKGSIVATINCHGYSMSTNEGVLAPLPTPIPTPTLDIHSGEVVVSGAPTSFQNCTELRKVYPSGVKSTHPAYALKHDGDKDGWACEVK